MKFGALTSILVFLFGLNVVSAEKLTFYESSFYTNSIGFPMNFGWFDGVHLWVWLAIFLIFWIVLYMLIRNFWLFKDHEGISSILAMLLAFVAAASPFSNFVNDIVTMVGFGGPGLLILLAFLGLIWLGLKIKIRWRRRTGRVNPRRRRIRPPRDLPPKKKRKWFKNIRRRRKREEEKKEEGEQEKEEEEKKEENSDRLYREYLRKIKYIEKKWPGIRPKKEDDGYADWKKNYDRVGVIGDILFERGYIQKTKRYRKR